MPSKTLASDTLNGAIVTAPAVGTVETWTLTHTPSDTAGLTNTGLGATAPYDLIVDDASLEIVHVTAVNVGARQITLTRGYAGSAPATHLTGASIKHIITGEYLNVLATTPGVHAATHAAAGSDPVTLTEAQIINLTADLAALAASILAQAPPYTESQITGLVADLALKANLASPTFTGTPAAPTAAPGTNTTQIATTAFVTTADALKANLASPTFTGTPAAPTATPGTNTTQLATTAFIQAAIAALVASSPATLDTLNEIAVALGNDPNFATTITNLLALKAPLASPALTGVPTAPTAAAGTSTTQLATTAFAAAVGTGRTTFNNANVVGVATDKYLAQVGTLSAPRTVTLPLAASVPAGYMLFVADESGTITATNTLTLTPSGANTITGITKIGEPYRLARCVSDGTSNWMCDKVFLPLVQDFTANGTSIIPPNCTTVLMEGISGGGGGGSGRRGAAGTVRAGGGGGSEGGTFLVVYNMADLGGAGTTLTVAIGAGGIGNAGKTLDDTDGSAGGNGGTTSVKIAGVTYAQAGVGVGGNGGTTTAGAGGGAQSVSAFPTSAGGAGGASAAGSNGAGIPGIGAGAGGGGGGISAANAHFAGGSGGTGMNTGALQLGNSGGTAGGGAGINGNVGNGGIGGSGGSGGGSNNAGAGGNGGNGIRGAGGGGGGASTNTTPGPGGNSGGGGNGGDGWVRIIYQ